MLAQDQDGRPYQNRRIVSKPRSLRYWITTIAHNDLGVSGLVVIDPQRWPRTGKPFLAGPLNRTGLRRGSAGTGDRLTEAIGG